MFYERLQKVCKDRGTTITAVAKTLNLSTGSGTNWKNGKMPSVDVAKQIADYLKVSMDYLMSDTEDLHNRPLTDNEIAMLELFEKLGERDQARFIGRLEEFVTVCNDKTGEYK